MNSKYEEFSDTFPFRSYELQNFLTSLMCSENEKKIFFYYDYWCKALKKRALSYEFKIVWSRESTFLTENSSLKSIWSITLCCVCLRRMNHHSSKYSQINIFAWFFPSSAFYFRKPTRDYLSFILFIWSIFIQNTMLESILWAEVYS